MKPIPEKTYHSLFEAGLTFKAVVAVGEIIAGIAFAFFSYDTLRSVVFTVLGGELTESPRDFVWGYIAQAFHSFSNTPQEVWAFIFLSHGIVKIFLLIGLWRNKLWAYPASAVVFILFIIYQFYQLTFTSSLALWLITILDIIVVILVIHEYRYQKKNLQKA